MNPILQVLAGIAQGYCYHRTFPPIRRPRGVSANQK